MSFNFESMLRFSFNSKRGSLISIINKSKSINLNNFYYIIELKIFKIIIINLFKILYFFFYKMLSKLIFYLCLDSLFLLRLSHQIYTIFY